MPGTGPPLIFIHGLGCASSCDYPCIASDPALAGRRMLLVDLLGSGFSDHPADFGYGVDDHARTVVELARHLSLDDLDLFGHSLGGSVAIVAAGLLGGRVRHLVLAEPNLRPGGGVLSRGIAAATEDDYVARGHDELARWARAEGLGILAAALSISSPSSRPVWIGHAKARRVFAPGSPESCPRRCCAACCSRRAWRDSKARS